MVKGTRLRKVLQLGELGANCYVFDAGDGRAVVVDPGGEGGRLTSFLREEGWTRVAVLNTHGHFDHCGANADLKRNFDAVLAIHEADLPILSSMARHAELFGVQVEPSPEPDSCLEEGEWAWGEIGFEILHTPGHSPGSVCLVCHSDGIVLSGDTLFRMSVGRTDLPGGSWNELETSIVEKLFTLPDEYVVLPGHGERTTIGDERRHNPFVGRG